MKRIMKTYWTFRRTDAARWALALVLDRPLPPLPEKADVVFQPGYESKRLLDILRACWYLNGGFSGGLSPELLEELEYIRESAEAGMCLTDEP